MMTIEPQKTLEAIMAYWQTLSDAGDPCTHWAPRKRTLDEWEACRFFLWVMLDQRQPVGRASAASQEFITKARQNHWSPRTLWQRIVEMKLHEIQDFCKFEYDERWHGAYAGINAHKFEGYGRRKGWLRDNAQQIIDEYEYVDNIWNADLPKDAEKQLIEIHNRLSRFNGIGNNLANMAVFSLVRDYGYAGGRKSKELLKIKFDTHVHRVIDRAIISGNPQLGSARTYVKKVLNGSRILESPTDFDYATFRIGQDFCQYDDCEHCPIRLNCNAYQQNIVDEYDDSPLPVAFLNRDRKCFSRYTIADCEVTCILENSHTRTFYASEDDIKRHDTGFSMELKEGFECSLRVTDEEFKFSMGKCPNFSGRIQDVDVDPFIGFDEILFVHNGDKIMIIVNIEIKKLDFDE